MTDDVLNVRSGSYSLSTREIKNSSADPSGPFTLVDADTRIPMRRNKFGSVKAAFAWGYRAYESREDKDFIVLDKFLSPVPKGAKWKL